MDSTRRGLDLERQSNLDPIVSLPASTAYETAFLPGPSALPEFQERAGQGCFICLQSHKQGQYAVLVPCMRPTKPRKARRVENCDTGESSITYKESSPWDGACESDYEIYQRLLDTCYQHLGRWKKWLPFYGITEVLEVNFQFADVVESNGRYTISMKPVDLEDIIETCKNTIARHPTSPSLDSVEQCANDYHSGQCTFSTEDLLQPCIKVQAEEEEKRLKRLRFLSHLKNCARNPKEANGLNTLKGMAQESCIYEIKSPDRVNLPLQSEEFNGTKLTRGLSFVLGWQIDRMGAELPLNFSCASLAIAVIWLCLVVWRGAGGDWGTAFAFAQVVAASFAIVLTYVRL